MRFQRAFENYYPGFSSCSSYQRILHVTEYSYPVPIYLTWMECGKCRLTSTQMTFCCDRDSNPVPCGSQCGYNNASIKVNTFVFRECEGLLGEIESNSTTTPPPPPPPQSFPDNPGHTPGSGNDSHAMVHQLTAH